LQGNVFIVGMGLIGGSLALSIKSRHPHAAIIGYDINNEQLQLAKTLGVIDEQAASFADAAEKADVIILACPVKETEKMINQLCQLSLKKDVIVTDTGSTKAKIMNKAVLLKEKGITFIGGHPMAGSHKSGVAAAKALLFENAFYLLTPFQGEEKAQIEKLEVWLAGTRAKILMISPEEHDQVTGVISHFPHIIAASLVHQVEHVEHTLPLVTRLAAGGFGDITRIASSSPQMWTEILLHNRETLLSLLEHWKKEMGRVRQLLIEKNEAEISAYFTKAKAFRDQIPIHKRGAIPSFYDLYVDVPDYPGVISEITGYLAEERISITNIKIIEIREDIYGVLVISFQNENDQKRAIDCLNRYTDYETFLP
jgi:prephenate dehydrogenase